MFTFLNPCHLRGNRVLEPMTELLSSVFEDFKNNFTKAKFFEIISKPNG